MKKQSENLFKIGEISKTLGVTRKAILLYEEMGLLTPAFKDTESGYRYYTADNMTQIRSIRSLQELGLSLKEIKEYYYDTGNIDHYLLRLTELRKTLDQNIQMLQIRSIKSGDSTVHRVYLPHQVCYCHRYQCSDTAQASDLLRDTYIAAVRTGYMLMDSKIFTIRITDTSQMDFSDITNDNNVYANAPITNRLDTVNNTTNNIITANSNAAIDNNNECTDVTSSSILNLMGCIPVRSDYYGPGRVEFNETPALCIYYRGPYDEITRIIQILTEYIKEHHFKITGNFRSTYLEGPPSHGSNSTNYITQVAVPVEFPIEF